MIQDKTKVYLVVHDGERSERYNIVYGVYSTREKATERLHYLERTMTTTYDSFRIDLFVLDDLLTGFYEMRGDK